ncbi:MAG: 2-dehydropantoate 2-reductase N-terminal domain-containing protein [Dehalococcoidia bacterium]
MRYIIYGAGAVGGVIGARLFQNGHDVLLIARGAHLDAINRHGLTLRSPAGEESLAIPAAGHPSEIDFHDEDVVILAMKTQDTSEALGALRAAASDAIPVFCAQNGVANERMALRRFPLVYGVLVFLPAAHMEPGVVEAHMSNKTGVLDLGCYPQGTDGLAQTVADSLNASDFSVVPQERIMRWKYAKLLNNLNNSIQAACGREADTREAGSQVRAEAVACYEAAGIDYASAEEMAARREGVLTFAPGGPRRLGGSSWQSLARGQGSIETDYLNGEIALLGRLHGVPTPANAALQRIAARLAREGAQPGAMTPDDVRAEIAREEAAAAAQ